MREELLVDINPPRIMARLRPTSEFMYRFSVFQLEALVQLYCFGISAKVSSSCFKQNSGKPTSCYLASISNVLIVEYLTAKEPEMSPKRAR